MKALLIMSCSSQKSPLRELLPAIDRYDGPPFRVLRKQLPTELPWLTILFISAKFGLIHSSKRIPSYDCRLTPTKAAELHDRVEQNLSHFLTDNPVDNLFVFGSQLYTSLISDALKTLSQQVTIQVAVGRPGERLAQLKKWIATVRESRHE